MQDGIKDDQDIDALFEEVKQELLNESLQLAAELYERQYEEEINVSVQGHTSVCVMCGNNIELGSQNVICSFCVNTISDPEC